MLKIWFLRKFWCHVDLFFVLKYIFENAGGRGQRYLINRQKPKSIQHPRYDLYGETSFWQCFAILKQEDEITSYVLNQVFL